MAHYRKLKADQSITGLLPAIIALSVVALASIFWGKMTGYKAMAGLILIFAILQYYAFSKVRSVSYFISATYILSFSLFLFFGSFDGMGFTNGEFSTVSKFLTFTTVFLLLWLIYLLVTRKTKWKGREVFELAAVPVDETSAGFTERPRPTGKISYSKHDLLAYADFLKKNHVALPFVEGDKIFLVPVIMGREFSLLYRFRPTYLEKSWIAFSFGGDVSVHISKKDYLRYKDQLSFDRLCESMGDLFKEFLELFLNNEEVRIIDRLDALKVNLFT
jgi:hypothetical protein